MNRVVVLGSGSFSGQDFVDLILNNYEVHCINRSRKPDVFLKYLHKPNKPYFSQLDLNKDTDAILDYISNIKPKYIINFAAQSEVAPSWEHPEDWYQTNTVALSKLVKFLCKDFHLYEKYIHISSPEIYGNCIGRVLEDYPHNPSTPYAASKSAADWINHIYNKQYGFPVITIRSTNVYGPRQQLFKIIPKTILSILTDKKIKLHGGGQAVKSYIHIRDISKGELAIMEKGEIGEVYHLSPDQGVSVRYVVETICKLMNVDFKDYVEEVEERPGQDAAYIIDSTKARTELEWKPSISLEDGLKETIDWININFKELSKESFEYNHRK